MCLGWCQCLWQPLSCEAISELDQRESGNNMLRYMWNIWQKIEAENFCFNIYGENFLAPLCIWKSMVILCWLKLYSYFKTNHLQFWTSISRETSWYTNYLFHQFGKYLVINCSNLLQSAFSSSQGIPITIGILHVLFLLLFWVFLFLCVFHFR